MSKKGRGFRATFKTKVAWAAVGGGEDGGGVDVAIWGASYFASFQCAGFGIGDEPD